MKKKTSITEIAQHLGVSVTSVSFIINGKSKEKRISDALTRRVLEYVAKIGYVPNKLAQSNASQLKVIGFLVDDISNTFFANISKFLQKLFKLEGYHLQICATYGDIDYAISLIEVFRAQNVSGIIVTPTEGLEAILSMVMEDKMPLILFDRTVPGIECSFVMSDHCDAAYTATKHLLSNPDNQRIGLVSLYSNQGHMRDRLEGYMRAMDEYRKEAFIKKIIRGGHDEVAVAEIGEFLENNHLDAVLYATNYLGILGLRANKKSGRLPATVAFDDHVLFRLYEPPISVIAQNLKLMAEELMKSLLRQIKNPNLEVKKNTVKCSLIKRMSSSF